MAPTTRDTVEQLPTPDWRAIHERARVPAAPVSREDALRDAWTGFCARWGLTAAERAALLEEGPRAFLVGTFHQRV